MSRSIDDLVNENPNVRSTIQKWTKDDNFDEIKDHFIENVPGGENGAEKDALLCHGKYLGIRFVFKELQRIAKQKPETKKKENEGTGRRADPDLEER